MRAPTLDGGEIVVDGTATECFALIVQSDNWCIRVKPDGVVEVMDDTTGTIKDTGVRVPVPANPTQEYVYEVMRELGLACAAHHSG